MDADEVIRAYGGQIDTSVRECLGRKARTLVGELLDE
jgi:hypothetical protein